jgi:hypothetical protein
MDNHEQVTIRVRKEAIDIILADGDMWFSQSCLAVIFETTTQNINLHLAKLSEIRLSKFFPVVQKEGSRTVQRKIRHFNFESTHAIAIRTQRFNELNDLVDNAARYGALKRSYRIYSNSRATLCRTSHSYFEWNYFC